MSRLNPLSRIVALSVSASGVRIELEGGHVFEYRRNEPTEEHPSLPPAPPVRVVETTGEAIGPGLAKVVPFRRSAARRVG